MSVDKLGNEDVPKLGYDVKGGEYETFKEEQKTLITEIMNKDAKDGLYDVREDDVEKLAEDNDWEEHIWNDDANKIAENVFPYDVHRTDYATEECRRIFILGFEMAKSTLYTEEQVREAIDMAKKSLYQLPKQFIYSTEEIIQSLKQPK